MTKRKAHNRIEMAGKIYNRWRVIEVDVEKSVGKALYWFCECLDCDGTYSVWGANLRSGGSKRCLKCGSGHAHALQKGQVRTKRTPLETAYHYINKLLRKDARLRGHEWHLSLDIVVKLVTANCVYCGIEPSSPCSPLKHLGMSQRSSKEATFLRNGIDRVDSNKGYTEDNVVSCCETCNKAKLAQSTSEFLTWITRVYKHSIKP